MSYVNFNSRGGALRPTRPPIATPLASGNIGQVILSGLVADSHFTFSVLSRANSSATFPSEVNVIKADYSDKNALVKALTGEDVVISAVGGEGLIVNSDKH